MDRVSREIPREFRKTVGLAKKLLRKDVIAKEEIIQILRVAPLREGVIIATMASSGLRMRAALNPQLANVRDNIWDGSLPYYRSR